jgi:hypothetical protein
MKKIFLIALSLTITLIIGCAKNENIVEQKVIENIPIVSGSTTLKQFDGYTFINNKTFSNVTFSQITSYNLDLFIKLKNSKIYLITNPNFQMACDTTKIGYRISIDCTQQIIGVGYSIQKLSANSINDVKIAPTSNYKNEETDIVQNSVYALLTNKRNYAIFQVITSGATANECNISFNWKMRTDGKPEF